MENQGKITLFLKNSSNQKSHKQINFTRINSKRVKNGTSNEVSLNTNKNYYNRNFGKRRIMSNSSNSQRKIFRSGFNYNLTNDKLNSRFNHQIILFK